MFCAGACMDRPARSMPNARNVGLVVGIMLASWPLFDAVALPVSQHLCVVGADFRATAVRQILEQVRKLRNRANLEPELPLHVLHGAVRDVLAVFGGHLLPV